VAILDGTNISRDRRKIISDKISAFKDKGYDILWIESSSVRGDDVSEQQFEELKNSPDFLDKVRCPLPTLRTPSFGLTYQSRLPATNGTVPSYDNTARATSLVYC
jgi:6-phosphofructo-2-kinase